MYSVNKTPKDFCSRKLHKLTSALRNYSRENLNVESERWQEGTILVIRNMVVPTEPNEIR